MRTLRLHGPLKYVVDRSGKVTCRCDLPATWDSSGMELDLPGLSPAEPNHLQWARALTRIVTGGPQDLAPGVDLAELHHQLNASGRSASLDDNALLIHVQQPGAFGQILLAGDSRTGYRLSAELRTLELGGGLREPSRRTAGRRSESPPAARSLCDPRQTSPRPLL